VPLEEVLTLGVYGFTDATFRAALDGAGADLLCDVRARRGVRGGEYAFANARRLEAIVAEAGLAYVHLPELAPPAELRALQRRRDAAVGSAQRRREELDPAFVAAYRTILDERAAQAALERIAQAARRPILLCVERHPAACHRSLAAERLAGKAGVPIRHVVP
jgi:uncharacterized protein (DUF488 family)